VDFVNIAQFLAEVQICTRIRSIYNSSEIYCSYSDLYFGVTFSDTASKFVHPVVFHSLSLFVSVLYVQSRL